MTNSWKPQHRGAGRPVKLDTHNEHPIPQNPPCHTDNTPTVHDGNNRWRKSTHTMPTSSCSWIVGVHCECHPHPHHTNSDDMAPTPYADEQLLVEGTMATVATTMPSNDGAPTCQHSAANINTRTGKNKTTSQYEHQHCQQCSNHPQPYRPQCQPAPPTTP